MTGTAFVAPRAENQNSSVISPLFPSICIQYKCRYRWLYRIRPSVAHQGFTKLPDNPDVRQHLFVEYHFTNLQPMQLESNFSPLNPKVHVSPTQLAWHPFDIPSQSTTVDFISGLKTLAGNGDPTTREGLAIHIYAANTSMDNKAFCNNDGDMLIMPNQGRLDVQTEFGRYVNVAAK
jgi:homogentisate 1,2-dioxygenase